MVTCNDPEYIIKLKNNDKSIQKLEIKSNFARKLCLCRSCQKTDFMTTLSLIKRAVPFMNAIVVKCDSASLL